jgi:hypothetical protein
MLVVWLASLGALRAQEMEKPLGKWERKIGKSHITLVVEDNRLHATILGEEPCTLHADYSMTKDGIIYGVVTSIECEGDDGDKTIFDAPFSCRYRIDEGALIIRDLRCHELNGKDDVWNGRFKAVSPAPTRAVVPPPPPASYSGPSSPSTSADPQLFKYWVSFFR